jgi:3-hydroxyacyl-CoA dehydrogenase
MDNEETDGFTRQFYQKSKQPMALVIGLKRFTQRSQRINKLPKVLSFLLSLRFLILNFASSRGTIEMNEIKHIGIIGEGKMGSNLFLYLLPYDYRLSWLCSAKEGKNQATKFLGKKLKVLLNSGLMTEQEFIDKVELTTISDDPGSLAGCDLVIEAITENLSLKRQIFQSLDAILKPSCIFTSNSSSILPSALAPSEKRAENMAGMHFFFPLNIKKTVELIHAPGTSSDTIQNLQHFLCAIGKKTLLENEQQAFVLNRLILDFQVGAYHLLQEGKMTMKEIDDLVKSRFFSIGIFDFFDHVGIDVMLVSIKNYTRKAGNRDFYAPLIYKMEELVSQNRLGFKSKQGFYTYCKSLGDITKEVSEQMPSKTYLQDVENRLLNYYISSVNSAIDAGMDPKVLADAVKDILGLERDPFKFLSDKC